MEKVTISIDLETLQAVIKELKSSLEPMVPYRIDPLEFHRAAHEVKDSHIQKALALLPAEIVLQMNFDLTKKDDVLACMQSSKNLEEWNANLDKVLEANDGNYPLFWKYAIVKSGIESFTKNKWLDNPVMGLYVVGEVFTASDYNKMITESTIPRVPDAN